jgi:hypothetical protein
MSFFTITIISQRLVHILKGSITPLGKQYLFLVMGTSWDVSHSSTWNLHRRKLFLERKWIGINISIAEINVLLFPCFGQTLWPDIEGINREIRYRPIQLNSISFCFHNITHLKIFPLQKVIVSVIFIYSVIFVYLFL